MTLNGCLAGLVAITAPCAFVSMGSALIIGAIAGPLVVGAVFFFDKLQLDDPVGALSVHLVNGVWGTLAARPVLESQRAEPAGGVGRQAGPVHGRRHGAAPAADRRDPRGRRLRVHRRRWSSGSSSRPSWACASRPRKSSKAWTSASTATRRTRTSTRSSRPKRLDGVRPRPVRRADRAPARVGAPGQARPPCRPPRRAAVARDRLRARLP